MTGKSSATASKPSAATEESGSVHEALQLCRMGSQACLLDPLLCPRFQSMTRKSRSNYNFLTLEFSSPLAACATAVSLTAL